MFNSDLYVNIWSKEFDLGEKGKGYLEKTYKASECPINWKTIFKGDIVNYVFPNGHVIYRVKIKDITLSYGDIDIQVEVLDIL